MSAIAVVAMIFLNYLLINRPRAPAEITREALRGFYFSHLNSGRGWETCVSVSERLEQGGNEERKTETEIGSVWNVEV